MKTGIKMVACFLLAGLIFIACAPAKTTTPPAVPQETAPTPETSAAQAPVSPGREAWEAEWEKLVEAAKREGTVTVVSSVGPEVRRAMGEGLKKKFGIRMESLTLRGSETAEKLFRERNAGLYLWDIYVGGSTTITTELQPAGVFDPTEPALILPEVRNPAAYWNGELPLIAYGYAISVVKYVSPPLLINTDLVKEGEIKSWKDLLNPKWKGKILMDDPVMSGSGQKLMNYIYFQNVAGGADFLKSLVKQEPAITRDRRLLTEWVARGKYAICLAPREEITYPFIAIGAPLKFITPVEGAYVTNGGGAAALINKPPHPNAAKVLLNWVLTREGNEIWSRAHAAQSSRVDVSTEFLQPGGVRQPGVKYFDSDNHEFVMKTSEITKQTKAIFAPILK